MTPAAGGGTLLSQKILQIEQGRKTLSASQSTHFQQFRNLPDIPVMPETLLLMELQAGGRCPALGEISQIVLADVGATLQILRLAGREFADAADRPARIEDCISVLGLDACLEAVSRQTVARSAYRAEISSFWNHAARIAALSALLADETPIAADPGDAYLAGLLHELGSLPSVLGWSLYLQRPDNQELVGLRLAQAWSLPASITDYFCECIQPANASPWTGLVRKAHFIEGTPVAGSSPDDDLNAQLYSKPSILSSQPTPAIPA